MKWFLVPPRNGPLRQPAPGSVDAPGAWGDCARRFQACAFRERMERVPERTRGKRHDAIAVHATDAASDHPPSRTAQPG